MCLLFSIKYLHTYEHCVPKGAKRDQHSPFTHPYLVKKFAKKESGIRGIDAALLLRCVGSITTEKSASCSGLKMQRIPFEMNL